MLHQQILSLLALLPFAFTHPTAIDTRIQPIARRQDNTSLTACNNSPSLCSKSYDSITHLGAHDSAFVRDATTGDSTSGDQFYNSTVQLDAGVRLLTTQAHQSNGALHLCHSSCDLLDAGLFSTWLSSIKTWLDSNPNDVVTLLVVNSDNAPSATLHQNFVDANIDSYAYVPPSADNPPTYGQWPTLQSLITSNKRLIVFIASLADTPSSDASYLMSEFNFVFENPYSNIKYTDFTCTPDRPSSVKGNTQAAISGNMLPLMNHFLYDQQLFDIQVPAIDNITTTNNPSTSSVGMLGQSAAACAQEYARNPTYILVDFFDQGPAINVVDSLNGVTDPVGRKALPAKNTNGGGRATSTFSGVEQLVQMVKQGKEVKRGSWIWAGGQWGWGGINLSGGQVLA